MQTADKGTQIYQVEVVLLIKHKILVINLQGNE